MNRGIDVLRLGATLLTIGVAVAAVPATAALWLQTGAAPGWLGTATTALVVTTLALGGAAWRGRRTSRLTAQVYVLTVLAATLLLPSSPGDAYTATSEPWVHGYLPSAVAATVMVSACWQLNLVLGLALVAADARMQTTVWQLGRGDVANDLLFELTVLAVSAAVFTSVALSQRELRAQAASIAGRFLEARTTEQLARRGAQWDALVHDEILAALETIALRPPDVDERQVAAAAVSSLDAGPPTGAVDAVDFRTAVLTAILTEYPTASSRFSTAPDARPLPHDVADALLMAVTEALRNVAQHAYSPGPGDVSVRLGHDANAVAIEVADHGRGFERSRVGPSSFGLALSIEGRLGAVGGVGVVTSQPGRGTTVRLQWPVGGAEEGAR